MDQKKYYAKVCYHGSDPGVIEEIEYNTKAEAEAFKRGFEAAVAIDETSDTYDIFDEYSCCVDTEPAKEE